MLIIFTDIKGLLIQEGQTINSTYYCDVLWPPHENVERLRPKLWLLHHNKHCLTISFHLVIFYQKQHDCLSHPPYFPPFPQMKTKLKGHHFDANEVIEAESQAVLNTAT
jgi:hypothetical protein